MKIHLKQIPADGLHFTGEEDCPFKELETDDMRCAGPLRYDIEVGLSEGALWANGSLEQPVELRCVSCLENFPYTIKVPAFALHTELHGPERVDLTPLMREDILLNLPAHPHCDRDGGRVCKAPVPPAAAKVEEPAKAAKLEHDWEALNKLKIEKR
jgi:uncharacterized metal-binding protein YceD (DUF177 family)